MKKSKLVKVIAILLCFMLLVPSCGLRRKDSTTVEEEDEDFDDEEEEEKNTKKKNSDSDDPTANVMMYVSSLDQFISDGSIFAENMPVATPTPIPVQQSLLGLTNDDDGYFSGPLNNASIVDNENFRFTIISAEIEDTEDSGKQYVIKFEAENKSDVPYALIFKDPVLDNMCTHSDFQTDLNTAIEPGEVLKDTLEYSSAFDDFDPSVEPTRIAFVLLAAPSVKGTKAYLSPTNLERNYVTVTLFPQGESAFEYKPRELSDTSEILYDNDGGQFAINYFETSSYYLYIHYTYTNKTNEYVYLMVDGDITLDKKMFNATNLYSYIAPFSQEEGKYAIKLTDIEAAGMNVADIKFVSIPLLAASLNGLSILWDADVKSKVIMG